MVPEKAPWWLLFARILWAISMIGATLSVWRYKTTPGPASAAPSSWPVYSEIPRAAGAVQIVMFVHPKCACSRASVSELASLLAEAGNGVSASILFYVPEASPAGWLEGDLWHSAGEIPGVTLVADSGGAEADRFGAKTSGQVFAYDARGTLLYSGGITGARGHVGDNPSRAELRAVLRHEPASGAPRAVFGCELGEPLQGRATHVDP